MIKIQPWAAIVAGFLAAMPSVGNAQSFTDSPSTNGFDEQAPLTENYRVVKANASGLRYGHYNLAYEHKVKDYLSFQFSAGLIPQRNYSADTPESPFAKNIITEVR